MLKFITIIATLCLISQANAGFVATHHVAHEPSLATVSHVVHSVPSAVSHQSITQVHGREEHVVKPVLAPVVHAAPLVVKTVHVPEVQAYHTAPIVHSVPLVHSAPVVSIHHLDH